MALALASQSLAFNGAMPSIQVNSPPQALA